MIPGTVPCDVSAGHVTAGLSPVSWRCGIYGRLHSARVILSLSNPGRSEGRTAEPFGSHEYGFPLVDPQNAYRVLTFKNQQFVADF